MSEQGASVSDVRIPTLDRIATRGLVCGRDPGGRPGSSNGGGPRAHGSRLKGDKQRQANATTDVRCSSGRLLIAPQGIGEAIRMPFADRIGPGHTVTDWPARTSRWSAGKRPGLASSRRGAAISSGDHALAKRARSCVTPAIGSGLWQKRQAPPTPVSRRPATSIR